MSVKKNHFQKCIRRFFGCDGSVLESISIGTSDWFEEPVPSVLVSFGTGMILSVLTLGLNTNLRFFYQHSVVGIYQATKGIAVTTNK